MASREFLIDLEIRSLIAQLMKPNPQPPDQERFDHLCAERARRMRRPTLRRKRPRLPAWSRKQKV